VKKSEPLINLINLINYDSVIFRLFLIKVGNRCGR